MAGLLGFLKRGVTDIYHAGEAVANGVQGQGFHYATPSPAPAPAAAPAPAPMPQQHGGWDLSRVFHDATHNPVTNFAGNDIVKPVTHFVTPAAHMAGSLASGAYHVTALPIETARTGIAEATNNPAATQAGIDRAGKGLSFLRQFAQGIPRAAYQLGESLNPSGGDVYNRVHTPTNPIEKFAFGKEPIPSMQNQYKQTAATKGKATAAGEAALTSVMDVLGGKGAVKGVKATSEAAPQVARTVSENVKEMTPTAKAANHPAVQAINQHLNTLNKQNDNLGALGLSEKSAPRVANRKAYAAAVQERNATMQSIAQGGYVKVPGKGEPAANGQQSLDLKVPAQPKNAAAPVAEPPTIKAPGRDTMVKQRIEQLTEKPTTPNPSIPEKTGVAQSSPTEVAPTEPLPKGKSSYNETVQKAPNISPEVKANLKAMTYRVRPRADMRAKAEAAVKQDLAGATEKAMRALNQTPGRLTDEQFVHATKVAEAHDTAGNHALAEDIYRKLQPHGTRTAQSLAARNELSKMTPQGMKYKAQTVLEKAGVKYEGKVRDRVEAALQEVRNTKPQTDARDIALQKLTNAVNKHIPRSKMQATIDFWRAGLLTGPETVAKIATSHLITSPMELLTRPAAAATDLAVSKLTPDSVLGFLTRNEKGAPTPGSRTVTYNPMDYVKATKGLVEGGKASIEHLKSGIDLPNTGGFEKEIGKGTKQTKAEEMVYRVHGSVYKPFYRTAYRIEEANQRRLAQDIFGKDSVKIEQYLRSPKAQAEMTKYAEQFAMQNETAPGRLTQTIQHFKPGGVPIGEWIAPFSRIPAALGVKGIVDYTPVGTLRAATTLVRGITKGEFDQRKFVESLSKSAVGGTALVAAGAYLMNSGRMTLQEPTDAKEKALWEAQGKQRNSVKVGNKWISMNAMGPVGIALGIGGAFGRAVNGGANGENAIAQAIGSGAKLIADQPYMKGVTGVGNVLQDPTRYAESYVQNSAQSFVPAGVQQIARGTDKTNRAYPNNVGDAIKSGLPGARESLPKAHDLFGADEAGAATQGGGAAGTVNPFFPSEGKNANDQVTQELQRLYDTLGTKSPAIGPTKDISIKGPDGKSQSVKLTVQQQQDMLAATGPQIHKALTNLFSNADYASLDDNQKTSQINNIINGVQDAYVRSSGLDPNKKLTGDAQLAAIDPGSLGSSVNVGGTNINPGLTADTRTYLAKMSAMSTDDRAKLFNSQNDAEYKYNLAKWQNDKLNGTMTRAQDIRTQQSLLKEQVGANYSKDTRDTYGLSKAEINNLITTDPNGQAIADQLHAYDQALYAAGVISTPKFKNGFGSSSGGGGRGRGGSRSSSFSKVDISNPSGTDLGSVGKIETAIRKGTIKAPSGSRTTFKSKVPKAPKVKLAKVSKKGKVTA